MERVPGESRVMGSSLESPGIRGVLDVCWVGDGWVKGVIVEPGNAQDLARMQEMWRKISRSA
jgi:hypothetical protein